MPVSLPYEFSNYQPWMIAYGLGFFYILLMAIGGLMFGAIRQNRSSIHALPLKLQVLGLVGIFCLTPQVGLFVFLQLVIITSFGSMFAALLLLTFGVVSWFGSLVCFAGLAEVPRTA